MILIQNNLHLFPLYFDKSNGEKVPNIFKAMANSPALLESYLGFSNGMGQSSLSAALREQIALAVAKENSKIIARGIIEGNHPESKGHLECRGLILDTTAYIHSIPEIIARKRGTVITHEAAIGKISDKEISYLMTRKLTHDQAVTMIIRGFMDAGFMNLPSPVNKEVNHIIDLVAKAS